MVIVGRMVLKDPNGTGRVEVAVSHNTHPGAQWEAERTFDMVKAGLLGHVTGDVVIEYPGTWAG